MYPLHLMSTVFKKAKWLYSKKNTKTKHSLAVLEAKRHSAWLNDKSFVK